MWKCEMGCKELRQIGLDKQSWCCPRQAIPLIWGWEMKATLCDECYNLLVPLFRATSEWIAFKAWHQEDADINTAMNGCGEPRLVAARRAPLRLKEEETLAALRNAFLRLLDERKKAVDEFNATLVGHML